MAAPAAPVEGLKLQTKTDLKRVDELVHEYETTTGSGRLRDTLRGAKLVFAPKEQKKTSEAVARRRRGHQREKALPIHRLADGLERGEGLVSGGLPFALGDLRGLRGCEAEEQRFPVGRLPHDDDALTGAA